MADILIVEDYPSIQTIYKNILQRGGHNVTTARDGEEALAATKKREFDVILLDILLPTMDGLTFLKEFDTSKHPKTHILIATNMDEPSLRRQATKLNVRKYLIKTQLTPDQLLADVDEVLKL
jgi:CheY-like chemotaxis protein